MALQRMDNVLIVVSDMEAMEAFFTTLGLEREGATTVEGAWVDQVVGLENVRCEIVMLRTPDGKSRIELSKFLSPAPMTTEPKHEPVNTLGLRRVMFAVDDIDATVAQLRERGAVLLGSIARYQDSYRLCYVRGPEGIIVGLAQELKGR
jgi:catechol 2,3-dioxygenase-like lactoylglutathione lyase family enzyme